MSERADVLLGGTAIVPILTVDDAERIDDIADALVAGGVSAVEVTLRTENAWDAIARLGARSDLVVGAGTVLRSEDVRRAAGLGAGFVVSPGLDESVVEETLAQGLASLPGVATPSEVQRALRLGLAALKLFPAEVVGGAAMLRALRGPFPDAVFMPSGGVSLANLGGYLAQPNVFAAGCSWLVTAELVGAGKFDEVRRRAQEAVAQNGVAQT